MKIGILGHAGLYVETVDQRVLIDPVFAETLVDGVLEYNPGRRLDVERVPAPTAIVVTHAHFDHYHPPSLERLPRDVPVMLPEDRALIAGMRRLGFSNLVPCAPWAEVTFGRTRLVATPSALEHEVEMGVVLSEAGAAFWHMADSEVTIADSARILQMHGRIDVVSAKYQPVVRASMGHLRARGARFDTQQVVEWLETACAVEPGLVFPYASGLAYAGRHAWFNRYALPLSAEEVADLLCRRLGPARAVAVDPGDIVEVSGRITHARQALPFVSSVPAPPIVWEPVDVSTLAGVEDAKERARLAEKLDALLDGPLSAWLSDGVSKPVLREEQVVWQLVVEAGAGERIERYVDSGVAPLVIGRGRHPRATSFTHVSGLALLDVLEGRIPGIVFWLAGEARSYQKNIAVLEGRLVATPVFEPERENSDPLTYFLRFFGPRGERLEEPPASGSRPEPEPEAPASHGERRADVEKQVLLGLLAEQEAARLSLPITDADIEETSDGFRAERGLHDPDETLRWLDRAGLTNVSYARVMRRYTAVRFVRRRHSDEIERVLDDHLRVDSARRGSR